MHDSFKKILYYTVGTGKTKSLSFRRGTHDPIGKQNCKWDGQETWL